MVAVDENEHIQIQSRLGLVSCPLHTLHWAQLSLVPFSRALVGPPVAKQAERARAIIGMIPFACQCLTLADKHLTDLALNIFRVVVHALFCFEFVMAFLAN